MSARASLLFIMATLCIVSKVDAHEGHRPLPTRGMEVNVETGSMILTKAARETLDVKTIEAESKALPRTSNACGSIVMPWNGHAVIASP